MKTKLLSKFIIMSYSLKSQNLKRIIISFSLVFCLLNVFSQNDTVIYYKDNKIFIEDNNGELRVKVINPRVDSLDNLLFEGVYGEDYSSEVNLNFTFSRLIKRENFSKTIIYLHVNGPSFGKTILAKPNLKSGDIEDAYLANAIEFDWNFVELNKAFSNKFILFAGFGINNNFYYSDNNTAFKVVDGKVRQINAPDNIHYSISQLYTIYFTVPVMVEFQNLFKSKFLSRLDFYINGGVELGVKFASQSVVRYRLDGKRREEIIDKGVNVNPFKANLKLCVGFGNIGFYAKYGLTTLFKKNKGPDVIPVSFGVFYRI